MAHIYFIFFLHHYTDLINEGHYGGAIGNFVGLIFLLVLLKVKIISEKTRKLMVIFGFYLVGLFILIETGSSGSGFVLIFWALILAGFFLDKEIAWRFMVFNILTFTALTVGLFAGIFDDKAIGLLQATWLLNIYIVQLYSIASFLLMNIMFEGLKKQASHIKEANVEVATSQKRYKEMIANIVDVIVIADSLGMIKYISPNVSELYGWESAEILNRSLAEKVYQEDRDDIVLRFRKFLKGGRRKKIIELRHCCKNGEIKNLEVTLINLLNDPVISGVLINFHDITERRRYEKKIIYLNDHDELTNLYNRTYFNRVKKEVDSKENLPLSVISADIDGLKIINDSFGHHQGDLILTLAARLFKKFFRQTDIIARVGGDEFYIILPQTGQDDAAHLIDRINGQIDEYNEQNLDEAHYLSISMGMACKSDSHDDFDAILHVADQEMYQVKNKKKADLNAQIMASLKRVLYNKLPDREKKGQRWVDLSRKMGQAIGLSDEDLKRLELLSTLGDVGKIISQETKLVKEGLTKPDKKTCLCPENSYRIAKAVPDLSGIAECILAHEEKWDGSGYPRGLKEREIPLLARIRSLAVFCEEFEAEDQEKDWQKGEKIAALKAAAGSKYDPALLNVLISIL